MSLVRAPMYRSLLHKQSQRLCPGVLTDPGGPNCALREGGKLWFLEPCAVPVFGGCWTLSPHTSGT